LKCAFNKAVGHSMNLDEAVKGYGKLLEDEKELLA
jgi:hypothetical protein